jgi:hypothetical protein
MILFVVLVSLLVARLTRLPASLDAPVVLGTFATLLLLHFMFFERVRVIERRGFRCQTCGYDLQGQVEPRCPECGREFDADDQARMRQLSSGKIAARVPRKRWATWAMVGLFISLIVAQLVGLYVWRSASQRQAWARSEVDTKYVLGALLAYAQEHKGRGPKHAAQLLLEGRVRPGAFLLTDSLSVLSSVRLADSLLSRFEDLPPEDQARAVRSAVERLPEGTIAHRLGDFVFTFHGVDLADPEPKLWVIVWSPDPAQNGPPSRDELIPVGLACGKVAQIAVSEFAAVLDTQNQLRADLDLPPLVNPFMVRHGRPMVGQPAQVP